LSEEDAPVSMGIVLDLSGSMKRILGSAKEALHKMMKYANPEDETFLNVVSTRPRIYSGFTRDFDEVLNRIVFEDAGGSTALFDTISESLQQLRSGSKPFRTWCRKADRASSDGRQGMPSARN
jgi:Ca-activated chloride channel family protein